MIAIRVRYYGPTNTRGAKLVATDGRHHLRIAYEYGDEDKEKLAAAKEFKRVFLPTSPALDENPSQFNGDNFYHFKAKVDLPALDVHIESIIDRYGLTGQNRFTMPKEQLKAILTRAILTAP